MIEEKIKKYSATFNQVVPFEPGKDKLYPFDFTENNKDLSVEIIADTEKFANYINRALKMSGCRYGIGGYNEHRTLYARSKHFDIVHSVFQDAKEIIEEAEPRRLHLGIDVWGPSGTKVMSPMDGIVHSFAFNNNDSDYGATIILTHNLEGESFHTLYGHLSLNSIKNLFEGKRIRKGEVFTEFGMRFENGNWPPHLHFQLIKDMQGWEGDYPGVCRYSEKEQWLQNCPDPDLILQLNQYI
ncbi:MAG: peptidoglycan DD-metalloendopeptidase family protein [Bacteroidetes bacterium]|nr:peptidoglycan DD-metalloendopeptidase family protein [Bacteroidota bacterium]